MSNGYIVYNDAGDAIETECSDSDVAKYIDSSNVFSCVTCPAGYACSDASSKEECTGNTYSTGG